MARYDWPPDLRKVPETVAMRAEANSARDADTAVPGGLGDLDALGDVVTAGFEAERQWLPMGPTILRQSTGTGSPTVAGRIRDLAVHPGGQRAYAGAANGGVWTTQDGGASWDPLASWALSGATSRDDLILTVGALLVEWGATANDDVIYVGTGELKPRFAPRAGTKHGGIGVLRLNGTVGATLANLGTNRWQREAVNLIGMGVYRLARDPATPLTQTAADTARIVAATSHGLFVRDGPFVEDATWTYQDFTGGQFGRDIEGACTDVLWTVQGLFVALMGVGDAVDGVWHSTSGPTGTFQRIEPTDFEAGNRLVFAASPVEPRRIYVAGKKTQPVVGKEGLAAGWLIDLTHTPAGVAGTPVAAVPIANWPFGVYTANVTFDGTNYLINKPDQSHFDNSLAVVDDGSGNDVVFVGGAGKGGEAHIYRLPITGTAAAGDLDAGFTLANQASAGTTGVSISGPPVSDPTYVGGGIHSDVHALRPAGATIWVGCDGGVYTRPDTASGGGTSRNVGLPTLEPGYLRSHPTLDEHLIAGLQDNGFIERVGGGLWQRRDSGDGGGCAYHPTQPNHVVKQYINADWDFIPARQPRGPALRRAWNALWQKERDESSIANFYSGPLALPGRNANMARLFIGTHRIWMTDNWRAGGPPSTAWMTWRTLPSGSDPHTTQSATIPGTNAGNDINQDRLTYNNQWDPVAVIEVLNSGNPSTSAGTRIAVLSKYTVRVFEFSAATSSWTSLTDAIVSGERPSGTSAGDDEPDPFLEYLPYNDGVVWTDLAPHTDTAFYVATSGRTRRNESGGLVPDTDYDTLWWYNGSGRWYPTGLRTTPPNAATGRSGTPASVHSVLVDRQTPNTVWAGTRIGVFEGQIDTSGEHPSWTWRPIMEGLPQTLVEDLSLFRSGTDANARVYLRAALVSLGVWERDVSPTPHTVGRSYIRAVPIDGGRGELPDPVFEPMAAPPGPALAVDSSPDILFYANSLPSGPWDEYFFSTATSQTTTIEQSDMDCLVQIHHRHVTPLDPSGMRVNLFALSHPTATPLSGITVDANLRNALMNGVNGATTPRQIPLATAGLALQLIEAKNPSAPLSFRRPGVVNFDFVDLTRVSGEATPDMVTLISIIDPTNHPFTAAEISPRGSETTINLDQVLRRSAYVAARRLTRS
ncbi:hypothetical protein [Ruegeria meonggei]|uniref:Glycosyl hydrolase n=1 Tax=Ruegeria meonggei TaxID=1446476 RepID=A0A1X6Z3H2_9RHOB|nr:hypothetical protein [Ruegeria meonggei]SLN39819.1 hypothetical protein RUM8411_01789 [Ruegeria meonggei]